MGTNDETIWLCMINPKVLEVLNQLLKAMEQLSMAPPKEEAVQVPHRMPGALLTVDEAAQRLGVSKYTLRGWVSQRRIPYVKIGGALCLVQPTWTTSSKPQPWTLENPGEGIKNYFSDHITENPGKRAAGWGRNQSSSHQHLSAPQPALDRPGFPALFL